MVKNGQFSLRYHLNENWNCYVAILNDYDDD